MKIKKFALVISAVMVVLLLCAFTISPTVRLTSRESNQIDVAYLNAQVNNDKLTITVNYDSDGEFFEIGRDIVVATDSERSFPLRIKSCNVNNGTYVYEFDTENVRSLDTVYIEPPILYAPTDIAKVSFPLMPGETVKMSTSKVDFGTSNSNWFDVRSVNVEEYNEGVYLVRVIVDAQSLDLPRFPKLCMGDVQIGGVSAISFDENDNFESGEFAFYVNAGSEKEAMMMIESATLEISDALIRVDSTDIDISSNVRSLSVIVDEGE